MSISSITKPKLLCILHQSPPLHGAAKVGDFIASSQKLKNNYECQFITIKSSDTIGDIGKINLKKIYLVASLYFKVLRALIVFRPQKIYFTASISSVAFYRDVLISTLWKLYTIIKPIGIYYHYHTKGVNDFVSSSKRNLMLTRFFVKNVNIILLSPMLEADFQKVDTHKQILFLPNGVENNLSDSDFDINIDSRYKNNNHLNVLYLSNMIKSKGYFKILELANATKQQSIQYHFAGDWKNNEDENDFFAYIKQNGLGEKVTFHGFIKGNEKQKLLNESHLLIFPTRYKAETFGLVIIEAFSHGIPVIATNEGSIPYILNYKSGIILNDTEKLPEALELAKEKMINPETARYCRKRYLKYFTLEQFESNLLEILEN